MSFPTIPTQAAGRIGFVNQLDTTATLTGPNLNTLTMAPGDLLIAIAGEYQSSAGADAAYTGWAGGGLTWTEIRDSTGTADNRLGVAYARVATGSETGTVTVTRSGTLVGDASMVVLVVPGTHPTTAPEATVMAVATAAAADPAALTPSWGAADTLWIGVNGNGLTNATGTWTANNSAPTNYTDYFGTAPTDTSTVGDFGLAVAFRQLNASSEDMGAFGQDTSNARSAALVIAVRPDPNTTVQAGSATVGFTAADATALVPVNLANNFEGGSDGVALSNANTGGTSGDAYTSVSLDAGAAVTFTTARSAHGSLAMRIVGPTAAGRARPNWNITATPAATGYTYVYAYLPSNPSGDAYFIELRDVALASTAGLIITSTGKLATMRAGATGVVSTGTSVPLNAWVRLECEVVASTTTGSIICRWFTGDSTSAGDTVTQSGVNTGANIGQVEAGYCFVPAGMPTVDFDDHKFSNVAMPALPAGATTAAAESATVNVTAADASVGVGVAAGAAGVGFTAADATVPGATATVEIGAIRWVVAAGAVTAGAATVPITAADAAVGVAVQAGSATVGFTATAATAGIGVLAGSALVTVQASGGTGSIVSVDAAAATVPIAAPDATVSTAAQTTAAAGTAAVPITAPDATVGVTVQAGSATVGFTATDATVSTAAQTTVQAGAATVSFIAADATTGVGVSAEAAAVTTQAADAATVVVVNADPATVNVAAVDAAAGVGVAAEAATIGIAAVDATVGVGVAAEAVTVGFVAPDAAVSTLAQTTANADPATVNVTAADPVIGVTVQAGAATVGVTAADATVSTVASTTANADPATLAVVAVDATVGVVVVAGAATVALTAADAVFQRFTDVAAQAATLTVAAADAAAGVGVPAGAATVSFTAADATWYVPPPVPPPRWVEGDSTAAGLVEGELVGAGMVEGSSSL